MLALCLLLPTTAALADIDEAAYQMKGAVRNEQERKRLSAQFEAELESERRRSDADVAAAVQARAKEQAREAALPYPERMTRRHCTHCHPAGNYTGKHHTWLAWRLIVLRMAWFNQAQIPFEAQGHIADYLAVTYPARSEDLLIEHGLPYLLLVVLTGMGWAGQRWWRQEQTQKTHHS